MTSRKVTQTPKRQFSSGVSHNASLIDFEVVAAQLGTSLANGLTSDEAEKRLITYGRNELPELPPVPLWKLFLQQFDDVLVKILIGAAVVNSVLAFVEGNLHGFFESFIISAILIVNAIVGVWQEHRAETAIDALKSFVPKQAHVVRAGKVSTIDAALLVPGDVVEVAVGMRIPADMRLCELLSTTLRVDQAILTGESCEVIKHADRIPEPERFPLNILFSGTAVVYGKARCIVVKTGSNTEIGAIERGVREQEVTETPLQQKLDEFGDQLTKLIGVVCLSVFLVHLIRWYLAEVRAAKNDAAPDRSLFERYAQPVMQCVKVAVALAVAAIPEGLPAVVTTCLALGTRRMAKHNALVRELPAVETLGRCTVICSDKTGTLTMNMMSVLTVFTVSEKQGLRRYTVRDTKYNVEKHCVSHDGKIVEQPTASDAALQAVAEIATLCNESVLARSENSNEVVKVGEATEAALKTLAEKLATTDPSDLHNVENAVKGRWQRNLSFEFTRERKSMSVHCTAAGSSSKSLPHRLFVKGAPESILARCDTLLTSEGTTVSLTKDKREAILREVLSLGSSENALRCLAFAFVAAPPPAKIASTEPTKFATLESHMTFCGVAGMLDPPRPEVQEAIDNCRTAGIRVIVITGDNKDTAQAICRKIGVFQPGDDASVMSFTGDEFDGMTLDEKRASVRHARLFARTDPGHKLQLVQLLQDDRLICAMTGDGVNDAPALKKADIGIAMGSGTEVAKSASKMVLADDNFASVVKAVAEGRAIYNNTKQFIRYLISSNIGEVVCILATSLAGAPDALEPVQLLWVNLVTDGLPATALGFNPPDPDLMEQPPRAIDEPIVTRWLLIRYLIIGAYVGLATVGGFVWWFLSNGFTYSELMSYPSCSGIAREKCDLLHHPDTARGIALSILVLVEMFNALNALSENQSITVVRPFANKWLLAAIASSLFLHLVILYVPALAATFAVYPLGVERSTFQAASPWSVVVPTSLAEWKVVFVFSFPVIIVDEVLKFLARRWQREETRRRLRKDE